MTKSKVLKGSQLKDVRAAIKQAYYEWTDPDDDGDPTNAIALLAEQVIVLRCGQAMKRIEKWRDESSAMSTPEDIVRRLADDLGVKL